MAYVYLIDNKKNWKGYEVCSPEIMYEREKYHIARLGISDPELGYNQK